MRESWFFNWQSFLRMKDREKIDACITCNPLPDLVITAILTGCRGVATPFGVGSIRFRCAMTYASGASSIAEAAPFSAIRGLEWQNNKQNVPAIRSVTD